MNYKTFEVNKDEPIKCDISDINNFSGLQSCSEYVNENLTKHYGNIYLNGVNINKNYEFNNLDFIKDLNNTKLYSNIYECDDKKNCKTEKLYSYLNFNYLPDNLSNYCDKVGICSTDYQYDNNYYLTQSCSGNDCNYKLNCACKK